MLNVRLDKETEKALKEYSERKRLSKSTVVKNALAKYLAEVRYLPSPFALGEDLFGVAGSKEGLGSTNYKTLLKEKLHAKHSS